eukprot:TRINITY_DN9208_c0_g1_i14.p1 TRINITY_DN9208_c0_g1~~TRINITY_DN9208_c0_g1_i14.p1  ORF type:complete len:268 (-),score=54.73 TRINITY_DN9208_c0_g1_i14:219-1022(-)
MDVWVKALNAAARALLGYGVGELLIVTKTFRSDSEGATLEVPEGWLGTLIAFDEEGDAAFAFDRCPQRQWVFRRNFVNLQRFVERWPQKCVVLELIPQGPFVTHWAVRVESGGCSRLYEFERTGVLIGDRTLLDQGLKIEKRVLPGSTTRSHAEIQAWCLDFGRKYEYGIGGGLKNCQDFACELCDFLEVDTTQLPWKQGSVVAAGLATGAAGLGVAVADLPSFGYLACGAQALAVGAAGVVTVPAVAVVGAVAAGVGLSSYMWSDS